MPRFYENRIVLIILAFWIGVYAGKWDAKHGHEQGLKFGKWVKENYFENNAK